jgi:hypothetical protein
MKILAVLFAAAFATAVWAADFTGTWKATIDTPNGAIESTFEFKVDGAKLTGTVTSAQMGATPISDGKIDGDNFSFVVKRNGPNGEFVINYKGTASGDDLKMKVEVPAFDRSFDLVAKKVK